MTDIDYAEMARAAGLTRQGGRPPFLRYLRESWQRRHFVIAMARYRVEASNSQTRLGILWIVLRPLFTALTYGLVFGLIMPAGTRPPNFIPYLVVGVFIFEFFSKCFQNGARSITGNVNLIQSLSFPRILMPVYAVLRQLIEIIPVVLVMFVIVWAFGETPRWTWLLVLPVVLLLTLFNLGVALIAARLTVQLRDVSNIIPFITRFLFYGSGIFFSLERVFAENPTLLFIAQLNPVHDFIAIIRSFTIDGVETSPLMWIVVAGSTVLILALGTVFFWRAEVRYGRG